MYIYVIDSMSDKEASSLLQERKSIDEENTNILPEIVCNSPKSTKNKTDYLDQPALCSDIIKLRKHVEVLQKKTKTKK